jgi:hypothetical protein
MNTINQILSGIRSILGITSSIRYTADGVKRETKTVSTFVKNRKEKKEAEKSNNQN